MDVSTLSGQAELLPGVGTGISVFHHSFISKQRPPQDSTFAPWCVKGTTWSRSGGGRKPCVPPPSFLPASSVCSQPPGSIVIQSTSFSRTFSYIGTSKAHSGPVYKDELLSLNSDYPVDEPSGWGWRAGAASAFPQVVSQIIPLNIL